MRKQSNQTNLFSLDQVLIRAETILGALLVRFFSLKLGVKYESKDF